jgi:hypothetical protein
LPFLPEAKFFIKLTPGHDLVADPALQKSPILHRVEEVVVPLCKMPMDAQLKKKQQSAVTVLVMIDFIRSGTDVMLI